MEAIIDGAFLQNSDGIQEFKNFGLSQNKNEENLADMMQELENFKFSKMSMP